MSLQVWLPLNGDLKNKGLANVTITNNGGDPVYDSGKIWNGLVCNGSKNWKINGITLGSEVSIAWWSKTETNKKMAWVLESTASDRLNIYENNVYLLNTGDSSNNPFKNSSGNNISVLHDGLWHHFVVTFGSSVSKLYIDGVYQGTALTFKDPACTNSIIKLAGDYGGGHSYDWNGMLNDFRVYDNCLSPLEVKELSRGLLLHFKLNSKTEIADSSGYSHHGIINTTNSASSAVEDTPRYDKAIYMNNQGSSYHIETDAIPCSDNVFSISFWLKADKSDNQVILADPKIIISFLNNGLYVCTSSSTPFKTTKFTNNEWNHIVAIRNGDDYFVYINGESISRFGTSNYYTHNASKLWILNRSYNTNYGATAYLSDLRIYSTILSQNDVLELYKVSGKIDNNGNIHGYSINELYEGKELMVNDFTIVSGTTRRYTAFSHDGMELSGYLSIRSPYIEIDPVNNNYIYDFTVSIAAGNYFYLGFERYDANKTSRSNNAIYYIVSTKPSSDVVKKRYHNILTSALNTDGVNPCKYIRLRILNGWTNSDSSSTKTATIHQLSVREIPKNTTAKTRLLKSGTFETDLLRETNPTAEIEKRIEMSINEFIEI